jgi:hypothetical protein
MICTFTARRLKPGSYDAFRIAWDPSAAQIDADMPTFHRRVNEMAAAVGRRAAVFLLELDGLGSTACIAQHGSLSAWEAALRYEVNKMGALPHTVVYLEAGYSDSNSVSYTADALNKIGIGRIRGFFTNDTHLEWTINEVRWATAISQRTHGAHFIVDTAENGQGPLLNNDPATQGNEDLCNPPGRGLGPQDTTNTGFRYADAAPTRQQQRLRRGTSRRSVLARQGDQRSRARESAPRSRLPQSTLLSLRALTASSSRGADERPLQRAHSAAPERKVDTTGSHRATFRAPSVVQGWITQPSPPRGLGSGSKYALIVAGERPRRSAICAIERPSASR